MMMYTSNDERNTLIKVWDRDFLALKKCYLILSNGKNQERFQKGDKTCISKLSRQAQGIQAGEGIPNSRHSMCKGQDHGSL